MRRQRPRPRSASNSIIAMNVIVMTAILVVVLLARQQLADLVSGGFLAMTGVPEPAEGSGESAFVDAPTSPVPRAVNVAVARVGFAANLASWDRAGDRVLDQEGSAAGSGSDDNPDGSASRP